MVVQFCRDMDVDDGGGGGSMVPDRKFGRGGKMEHKGIKW